MMAQAQENNNSESGRTFVFIAKWTLLGLIIALGVYLRARGIGLYLFNQDEFRHINIAKGASIADVLRYSHYEIHPPLFYILMHYWMMISNDPMFMRLLPLTMSVSLIPLYYLIGTKMDNELSGLCGATLMALSYGCVIQSSLMRQYTLLLLITSLHFYVYICWRETHQRRLLPRLVISGWLAVLSHFSAIFYIFCIALVETISLIRKAIGRQVIEEWILTNLLIGGAALFIYLMWLPYMTLYYTRFVLNEFNISANFLNLFLESIVSLFQSAHYIYQPFPLLLAIGVYAVIRPLSKRTALRPYFVLCGFACLLSMTLYMTGAYPRLDTRHNLWLLPFILPIAGSMVAALVKNTLRNGQLSLCLLAAILLPAVLADIAGRFPSGDEYSDWQAGPRQALLNSLKTFGRRDLIVDNHYLNINMLTNIYPYFSDDAFLSHRSIILIPYDRSQIFLSYRYFIRRGWRMPPIESLLTEAEENHDLDDIDRLVFIHEPFADVPGPLRCAAIPKQTIRFPSAGSSADAQSDILPDVISITIISKKAFLDNAASTGHAAHSCLRDKTA